VRRRTKRGAPKTNEKVVRALLEKYDCPMPYHAVRTRFLGALVSPVEPASPVAAVKGLWGGEFPAFDGIEAVNELMQVLVMGLWNDLTQHQKANRRFRFVQLRVPSTIEGLAALSLVRREEIDGFVEGLFGEAEQIDLPESGYRALGELGEIRAMLAGVHELSTRPEKNDEGDAAGLIEKVEQVGVIAEYELHQAVLSCVRARRQLSHALPVTKPVFH
jgi:hypothetical protein